MENIEDMAYIAICLLPYLLEKTSKKTPDPQSFLYQIFIFHTSCVPHLLWALSLSVFFYVKSSIELSSTMFLKCGLFGRNNFIFRLHWHIYLDIHVHFSCTFFIYLGWR